MPPHEELSSVLSPCAADTNGEFFKDADYAITTMLDTSFDSELQGDSHLNEPVETFITEPKTGIKFPSILPCQDKKDVGSQVLVGVGIKCVTIFKIYAFGFYVKPDKLRTELGEKYRGLTCAALKSDPGILEDLLRCDMEMTVRLVVHYKALKMGMVRSAFDNSLRNRLKKIKGVESDDGLHIFNSYLSDNLSLTRGSVIDFHRVSISEIQINIDGRLIGIINSSDFCRALFDIYIGDPPVCSKAKQEIAEKVLRLLRCN